MITQHAPADRNVLRGVPAFGRPGPGPRDAARPFTLDAVFTRAAHRRPGAIAVWDDAGRLTYGRAEIRATQLASALVRGGVQLGDPVIVHCDDHPQSVVAQLAVLKSGGVCVPVAHGASAAAAARIAALSGAQAVLCSASGRAVWPGGSPVIVLDDPEVRERLSGVRADPSLPRSGPLDAAYLLVDEEDDAGAGGQLVDHLAWQHLLAARLREAGAADGAVAVRQPPTGPRTLSAMWWAFAGGGTLHHRSRDRDLVHGLGWARTTAAVFSPEEYRGVLAALADSPDRVGPRTVVLVGGPCPQDVLDLHFALLPRTSLRAEFTPSGVMPWTVQEFPAAGATRVAPAGGFGSPVPNVQVEVLDREGCPLPPGRVGEVCATGPSLPFERVGAFDADQPDLGLLHRSDWLGRWRTDGTLELTGARSQV
ncbi:AMP-binding protein [Kitasatospora sp. NPDC057223]|uniref:AMP-binding protein n=1 Tax=Kitasatospora sp. NPDC057223 TaxID=3346055 RepID=UPI0036412FFE